MIRIVMIDCDITLQRESIFALSIALRVTNFPSKDCNIIAWIVPVLKMTIAFKQVNSVGSTLINLNLSMTS